MHGFAHAVLQSMRNKLKVYYSSCIPLETTTTVVGSISPDSELVPTMLELGDIGVLKIVEVGWVLVLVTELELDTEHV
jgi:hypothetical protein